MMGILLRSGTALLAVLLIHSHVMAAEDSPDLSPGRQVMVLNAGVDSVVGSYFFLIRNTSETARGLKMGLLLPVETTDWVPGDGVSIDDIRLGAGGGLVLEKEFPPGETLVSLRFKVDASLGETGLRVRTSSVVRDLVVFYPHKSFLMTADDPGFVTREKVPFSGGVYDTLQRTDLEAGKVINFQVTNLPRGRMIYWIVGAVLGLALVLGAGFMAWRNKPGPQEASEILEDI